MKPNRLSSRPIHIDSMEWADRAIATPDSSAEINKMLVGVALTRVL